MYIQHVAMKGQSSANSVQDTLTGIHKAPCLARLLHVEATNTFRNSKDGQLIVDVVHCYPIYPNRTLIFIYMYIWISCNVTINTQCWQYYTIIQ